jgi:hypothetical protein
MATGLAESFPEREPHTTAITPAPREAVVWPATEVSLSVTADPPGTEADRTQRYETDSVDIKRIPSPDRNGWITIPVTQLSFAPLCCECCYPTWDRYYIQIGEGFRWFMLVPFLGRMRGDKVLDLPVPLCPTCRRKDVAWHMASIALVLVLHFAPIGFLLLIAYAGLNVEIGLMLFFVTLIFARFSSLMRRNPFQARYNESAKTISLRFRAGVPAAKMLLS